MTAWQSAVPHNWAHHRLKWCFKSCRNGVWGNEPDGENDIIVVRVADFDRVGFRVCLENPTLRAISPNEQASRQLKHSDLLIEKSGGGDLQPVGIVVSYEHDMPAVCSNFVARLEVSEKCVPRFLTYLNAHLYSNRINQRSIKQTTGIQNLDTDSYLNELVAVPDQDSQHRIADYLDAETAEIDALVAEKERMLALLEEKRAALVTHAVTRGLAPNVPMRPSGVPWLGDVPKHWETRRLKFLAEVRTGLTIGKNYGNRDVADHYYLRVANVQDGYLSLDDLTTVAVPENEAVSCLLQPGDVLMNEGGDIDKLGRGCVWRGEVSPCLHQNHVFCVRPHSVNSDWLAKYTATASAKSYFESRAKRTTNLASISSSNIKELAVPLPPAKEQDQIMVFLAKSSAQIDDVRKSTTDAIELLKERRCALITAAVTGQIPIEEMAK